MRGTAAPSPQVTQERRFGRQHPRQSWTLRTKMLLILALCLVGVSTIVGVMTVSVYHSIMLDRLDEALNATFNRAIASPGIPGQMDPNSSVDAYLRVPGQPIGTIAAIVSGDSIFAHRISGQGSELPRLDAGAATALFSVLAGQSPVTIALGPLGFFRASAMQLGGGERLVIALPVAEVYAESWQLATIIVLVSLGGLILALVAGSIVLHRATAPLERMTHTAQRVSNRELDRGDVELNERVPVDSPTTEVGRLGTAFNRMLDNVSQALMVREASERKVRHFVADASHELRTPLASIRGYSELTKRHTSELPEDVVHAVGRIESEAVRMTELVEDLLLLARLDEGRSLTRSAVDIRIVVADMVGDAQVAGEDHEWSAQLPDVPAMVECDESRLRQVVGNLLANARVHTPPGTDVHARVDIDDNTVHVVVSDSGPGIDPAVQATIFERFVRGDASRSRLTGSTGLGLAIVRAVTEAYGGTVAVERVGGRTEFTVNLPRYAMAMA